jgi:hypothetical protein
LVEVVRAGDIHLVAEGDLLAFCNGLAAKNDDGDLVAYPGPVPDAACHGDDLRGGLPETLLLDSRVVEFEDVVY